MKQTYWFAGMRRFITKYVQACLNCAYYKHTKGKKQCKLNPIEKVPVPFHTVHIDHVGPFETSRRGSKFLSVMVDAFTKFVIIEPVKSQKTRYVVKRLTNVIYIFGCPTRIISARGTAFTARSFRTFCDAYGIKHILNAVATPRANGQCERYNKTITAALSTTTAGKDLSHWDNDVKKIQSALNTCLNKGIGTTPTKALIGYETKRPAEGWLLSKVQEVDRVDLQLLRKRMKEHISVSQRKQKEYYDKTRRTVTKYKQGDLVMVDVTSEAATGATRKLLPKFRGSFRITKVILNDRYEVEDLREQSRGRRTVVAADRMKRWITVQYDTDNDEADRQGSRGTSPLPLS